jgi:nucleoside-diphosphate-sugar epimerase
VDKSIVSPKSAFEVNTFGTLNILDSALESDVQLVIYASSSEAYGSAQYVPMDEKHPLNPGSPYAASKAAADRLCFSYYNTYGLPVVVVRSFNTYGPRMRLDDGRVVPNLLQQALRHEPLTVYGDGSQTRSFCYVDDLIEGLVRLLFSAEHRPVNLGNPDGDHNPGLR